MSLIGKSEEVYNQTNDPSLQMEQLYYYTKAAFISHRKSLRKNICNVVIWLAICHLTGKLNFDICLLVYINYQLPLLSVHP